MAEPAIVSSVEYWIDYNKKDAKGNPTIYMQDPGEIPGGWFGSGNYRPKKVTRVTYETGEIYDFDEDQNVTYVKTEPQLATAWRASQKPPTSEWSLRTGGDGRTYRVNELTGEALPVEGLPPETSGRTEEQDALAAAQAEYYRAQAGNVGKPTPRTYAPWEQEEGTLKNRQLEMQLAGTDPTSLYRQQTLGQNQAEFDYKKQQDELTRQRQQTEMDFARQQQAWRTASDMVEQQMRMAPYAARPGQEYWQGWGPGEAWSVLRPKLGLPYDPAKFKAPMIQYDPEEAWRRAMGMYGGQ